MDPVEAVKPSRVVDAAASDPDGVDVTSWVSVCPRGLWVVHKTLTHTGRQQKVSDSGEALLSVYKPRLGSLCRVRVCVADQPEKSASVKDHETKRGGPLEVPEAAFRRQLDSVLQIPLGEWTTLKVGEGYCDVTEACVEAMRAGEACQIRVTPANGADMWHSQPMQEIRATVELQAFTPGKESWQMSSDEKWEWVRSHKERGGQRFRSGDLWGASDSYSRALKLVITLQGFEAVRREHQNDEQSTAPCKNQLCGPTVNNVQSMKAELHSNLSLCQLKLKQPVRAKENAAKATQLEPGHAKAWYRLGQACQIVNELEEARFAFHKLLKLQPESTAAMKALKDITSRERETNAQLGQRLSKMFN
ncbi:FK506-binding protein-like isoform X1 [Hippocampus comes]|uniref:FKBP prolyl isomerase like n=1 Tax=Hippocampus comes TaxID=109280 RepID=A0A3Q2XCE5_HIPCM|nr:PREDICTED: FK506-binding protein-like isoform X1 [Hippocampus comes]XP_019747178.1 PREDICTED: FK506-binding protein-like isoform X1 [Hippocampus comes]XP_019747179.1 PREDICTED: FK506-binding protein-like isoform X1 [Hippocampus comes]XP_019747180.1 PREDICTED: FK506-binding protein-like isoform X1 [Hippocampus comes]